MSEGHLCFMTKDDSIWILGKAAMKEEQCYKTFFDRKKLLKDIGAEGRPCQKKGVKQKLFGKKVTEQGMQRENVFISQIEVIIFLVKGSYNHI